MLGGELGFKVVVPIPMRALTDMVEALNLTFDGANDIKPLLRARRTFKVLDSTLTRGVWRFKGEIPDLTRDVIALISALSNELGAFSEEGLLDLFSSPEGRAIIRNVLVPMRETLPELQRICYSRAPMISHELLALLEDIIAFLELAKEGRVSPSKGVALLEGEPEARQVLKRSRRTFLGFYSALEELNLQDAEEVVAALEDLISVLSTEELDASSLRELQEYASLTFVKAQGLVTAIALAYEPLMNLLVKVPEVTGVNVLLEGLIFIPHLERLSDDSKKSLRQHLLDGVRSVRNWVGLLSRTSMIHSEDKEEILREVVDRLRALEDLINSLDERHPEYHQLLEGLIDRLHYAADELRRKTIYLKGLPPESLLQNPYREKVAQLEDVSFLDRMFDMSYQVYVGLLEKEALLSEIDATLNFWRGYLQQASELGLSEELPNWSIIEASVIELMDIFQELREAIAKGLDRDAIINSWLAIIQRLDKYVLAHELMTQLKEEGSEVAPELSVREVDGLRTTFMKKFYETSSIEYEYTTKMGKELKRLVDAAREGKPHRAHIKLMLSELSQMRDALIDTFSSVPTNSLSDELLIKLVEGVRDLVGVMAELEDMFRRYLEVDNLEVLNPADLLIQSFDYKTSELERLLALLGSQS